MTLKGRRRSGYATQGGLMFVFGGFDGHKYHSDIHVCSFKPILDEILGIPRVSLFNEGYQPPFSLREVSCIKVYCQQGTITIPKFWLLLRLTSTCEQLQANLSKSNSLFLTNFSVGQAEDFFSRILRGEWGSDRTFQQISAALNLQEHDLIKRSDVHSLEARLKQEGDSSATRVSITGMHLDLFIDQAFLARYSSFFRENMQFSADCRCMNSEHSMDARFLSYIKLTLEIHFQLESTCLDVSQLIDAWQAADYLVAPIVQQAAVRRIAELLTLENLFQVQMFAESQLIECLSDCCNFLKSLEVPQDLSVRQDPFFHSNFASQLLSILLN